MTESQLKKASALKQEIDEYEYHLGQIKHDGEFKEWESVTLLKEFFPYPIKDFMDLYMANIQNKITDLKDEFNAL